MVILSTDTRLNVPQVAVRPAACIDHDVIVPGSKSYTNRYLAIGSLAGCQTRIQNALVSDDTVYFAHAIGSFGHVSAEVDESASRITIRPTGRPMRAPAEEVFVGGAGTPLRFLVAMAGHADGTTIINGNRRMQERPMADLVSALPALGVGAETVRGNGSAPVRVTGGGFRGGRTSISGATSSQFTSSLLLNSVAALDPVEIDIVDDLVSKPFVDMTIDVMARQGVHVERDGYRRFTVPSGQSYQGGEIAVEPDASGMSYFLCAAAILGCRIAIPGIGSRSKQGDVGLVDVLVRMGCNADVREDSITLKGGQLRGIDVDMESMPDVVPSLAVVAAFAEGRTHISNIASLRVQECDRIAALTAQLRKMGISVDEYPDAMTITGGTPRPATIDTYNDHRIAMSFAIAGLRTEGMVIRDPGCVAKSFPKFWQTLDTLYTDGPSTA
jgi:3-phosphoshikimate 1-carboxyvinyltransferase